MSSRSGKRPKAVREPIQVYLDSGERGALERLARELGVSRAEVLRRGLEELERSRTDQPYERLARLVRYAEQYARPGEPRPGSIEEQQLLEHEREVAEYLRRSS